MKKISICLAAIIFLQNISYAFVTREITVTLEKTIPFSFLSDSADLVESLSIKGLSDVKIKKVYVDNGEITANIDGNYIDVELNNGEWSNSYKTISKSYNMDLENVVLTDEKNKKLVITPAKDAISINDVSGDFSSAKILDNGNIEITIKEEAQGVLGYDENTLVESEFTINIDEENKNREIQSETISLPYEIIDDVVAKSGDTSKVQEINAYGNQINVVFNNGTPKENETTINSGYTYFWIDRDEEGNIKKYDPNAIYSTDINKITGLGEYVDENDFDEIGLTVSNNKWEDYCGIEKDGVRYIYIFDESRGIPSSFFGSLVKDDEISFDGQELNSEKFTVKFSNTDVSYIPEGKLYSMGELVSNTKGWGETVPNKEWESQKSFFNELTGKLETYVKHFKFFYGPKEKKTFGGYYTYPYSCTFSYKHYKPVNLYSGTVLYEYESQEKINGYSYNGWVKIEYKAEKTIADYPPTAPFNVKYNTITGNITWENGNDDYTAIKDLKYEIQIFDGSWKTIENKTFLELLVTYIINYSEPDVRIRSIDEENQVSDWTYASRSEIELKGELTPYIVKPGDNIDIFAETKSLSKIQNVIAKNDEMQMYVELEKNNETTPNFYEMSYDIEADFPEYVTDYLVISNGRMALGNKEEVDTYRYTIKNEFDNGNIDFNIAEDINMDSKGTLIFSNLNYNSIPVNMFYYNSKYWFASFNNKLYINNKITNSREIFFEIESDTYGTIVDNNSAVLPRHRIRVNNFKYDSSGKSTYTYVDVDKALMSKPFVITWDTNIEGVTAFNMYMGDKKIYTYEASWNEISEHVDNFSSIYMYKQMKNFIRTTFGYRNSSSASKAKWNNIVLSLVPKYDLRNFTWLGYRVRNNEYVKQEYIDEYNANPSVRNNYRLLICDEAISKNAIKRYIDILKQKNITMTKDNETIFGDDAMEYTSTFAGNSINIPSDTIPKSYEVDLVATDVEGKTAEIKLTLIVEDKNDDSESSEDSKVPETEKLPNMINDYFGRFFYKDNKGYLEELKKVEESTDTNGFICAGETLGFTVVTTNTDYIEVDFLGDSSIKTLDSLTKKFLIDIPAQNGKDTSNIEHQYMNFPKKIYPQYVDNDEMQVFKWFYTIPYKTFQNLESWSTLKNSTLENIDVDKLFNRRAYPYELIIYLNGNRETGIHLPFDVFERWDTVLNRDVSSYIINSDTRWEMRLDK